MSTNKTKKFKPKGILQFEITLPKGPDAKVLFEDAVLRVDFLQGVERFFMQPTQFTDVIEANRELETFLGYNENRSIHPEQLYLITMSSSVQLKNPQTQNTEYYTINPKVMEEIFNKIKYTLFFARPEERYVAAASPPVSPAFSMSSTSSESSPAAQSGTARRSITQDRALKQIQIDANNVMPKTLKRNSTETNYHPVDTRESKQRKLRTPSLTQLEKEYSAFVLMYETELQNLSDKIDLLRNRISMRNKYINEIDIITRETYNEYNTYTKYLKDFLALMIDERMLLLQDFVNYRNNQALLLSQEFVNEESTSYFPYTQSRFDALLPNMVDADIIEALDTNVQSASISEEQRRLEKRSRINQLVEIMKQNQRYSDYKWLKENGLLPK